MSVGREEGFTLIEITMVLIVLGILSAVAVSKFFDLSEEAEKEAVLASAAELQARSEAVFGKKVLEGLSCTEARTFAADVAALSDAPGDGSGRFGDFEFRKPAVVADGMPIDYRRAGSGEVWKTVPNYSFVLPVCGGEASPYLSSSAGVGHYREFLATNSGSTKVINDNGYQFSIYSRDGKWWFNSNVIDWNHTGTPIVEMRREPKGRILNAYIGIVPTEKNQWVDDLFLTSPRSQYADVTPAKRAENLEVFKRNFPDYQTFFEIRTTADGYQYLVSKPLS